MIEKEMGERMAVIETKIDSLTEIVKNRFKLQEKIDTKQNCRLDTLEQTDALQNVDNLKQFATKDSVEKLIGMMWKGTTSIILLLIAILGFMIKYQFFN